MQIEYETTINELVDAHMRAFSRLKSAKRARLYATIWTALFTGIILYLYLAFLGAPLIPDHAATVYRISGPSLQYSCPNH